MLLNDILNSVNLPITIWVKKNNQYVVDFHNGRATDRHDTFEIYHRDIDPDTITLNHTYSKSESSIWERQRDCCTAHLFTITFTKLNDGRILEISYPTFSNQCLLVTISKKLRESLTNIIGILALLDEIIKDESENYSQLIRESSYHFICLANDIVDIIAIDTNDITFHNEKFDLIQSLNDCLLQFKTECDNKLVLLRLKVADNVPKQIMADESRLCQIITNLVENAIFHTTKKGSVEVELNYNLDHHLIAEVKDTGNGIDLATKKIVDHLLYKCDNSSKLNFNGFGLFISSNIARGMGGHIDYESVYGEGSKFVFHIKI